MFRFLCATVLSLFSLVAVAIPGDGLLDDALLERAVADIGKMGKADLVLLEAPLSSCAQLDAFEGGLPRYYCHKELIRFRASGTNYRNVEELLSHYYLASRTIPAKGREGMLPMHEKLLTRYLVVLDQLVLVTATRYRELSRLPEQPKR